MQIRSTHMAMRMERLLSGTDETRDVIEPPRVNLRGILERAKRSFLIADTQSAALYGFSAAVAYRDATKLD